MLIIWWRGIWVSEGGTEDGYPLPCLLRDRRCPPICFPFCWSTLQQCAHTFPDATVYIGSAFCREKGDALDSTPPRKPEEEGGSIYTEKRVGQRGCESTDYGLKEG